MLIGPKYTKNMSREETARKKLTVQTNSIPISNIFLQLKRYKICIGFCLLQLLISTKPKSLFKMPLRLKKAFIWCLIWSLRIAELSPVTYNFNDYIGGYHWHTMAGVRACFPLFRFRAALLHLRDTPYRRTI